MVETSIEKALYNNEGARRPNDRLDYRYIRELHQADRGPPEDVRLQQARVHEQGLRVHPGEPRWGAPHQEDRIQLETLL